ncbi:Wadjet anti-phage system protein JetD domain-containing protein [Streptomyces sp. CT34]|uniref:Wadjet anti-phage system protein JetD domain-containing protein n=1 Tax=Streptomyces sp. CT34 TaxID=1553907 RepID=UPI0012FEC02B|nr:Wadjet anti-phage system protein JetD domain-containing protein [Streptomyces sp. CT34]
MKLQSADFDVTEQEEADLHENLVEGEFGHNVRLEQERVRYHLLEEALSDLHDPQ